jgi:general L-amino acid transport system permease protein
VSVQARATALSYRPGEHPDLPPPVTHRGVIGWMRENLFSSVFNTMLTIAGVLVLAFSVPPILDWAFFGATFTGEDKSACTSDGACWVVVGAFFDKLLYGFFPETAYWRVNLAFVLLVAATAPWLYPKMPLRMWLRRFSIAYPFIAFWLLSGGWGLEIVPTANWGGFVLTMVVGVTGIVASLPLGILLALGRRSNLPVLRVLSVAWIELFRGAPLIVFLFMAANMLPLFMPGEVDLDLLVRALVVVTIFSSAYMAEVVRGGLQAIPRGQYEAARALGLSYWRMMGLVILPQALRIVIPGIVNTFIGLFKDTTLVAMIGLLDLLNMGKAVIQNTAFQGLDIEIYAFCGLIYWVVCFGMSRYSIWLEGELNPGRTERAASVRA